MVSTIGGTPADPQADSVGNINLIQAALEAKVRRFILVTSIGVGDSKTSIPDNVYEVLASVLIEKEKAEEELKVRDKVFLNVFAFVCFLLFLLGSFVSLEART